MSARHRIAGMTLIELMIVLAVMAVLLALAVPSFVDMTQRNRVASEINGFVGDLQFARAEAIKKGFPITICASDAAGAACSGTTWQNGWIVFDDPNGNKTVDAGETVLRKQSKWSGSDTFTASGSTAAISYSRDGFAMGLTGSVTLTLKTSPVNVGATRCVTVNLAGRQLVQSGSVCP